MEVAGTRQMKSRPGEACAFAASAAFLEGCLSCFP